MATTQDATERLLKQYIEQGSPWEEARLRDNGTSVRAILGHLLGMNGDRQQTADDYEIPVEAVDAVVAYYERCRAAIDARLYPTHTA